MGLGLSRGDGSVGGGAAAVPHPLAGTGFTFGHVEDITALFQDQAGTTPCTETEGQTCRRAVVNDGSLFARLSSPSDYWKIGLGGGSHGINGKPTIYTSNGGFANYMSSDLAVNAMGMADSKVWDLLYVVRRVDATNNIGVVQAGGAMGSRQYGGNVWRLEGFITGYTSGDRTMNTGVHVLHVRCATNKFQIAVDGGTALDIPQTASGWANNGTIGIGDGIMDFACWGIYDGHHADIAALIASLMDYYGIT